MQYRPSRQNSWWNTNKYLLVDKIHDIRVNNVEIGIRQWVSSGVLWWVRCGPLPWIWCQRIPPQVRYLCSVWFCPCNRRRSRVVSCSFWGWNRRFWASVSCKEVFILLSCTRSLRMPLYLTCHSSKAPMKLSLSIRGMLPTRERSAREASMSGFLVR